MIFTIGYQKLPINQLERILEALGDGALLIDVRSSPQSRKPGYGQHDLRTRFGDRIRFSGSLLGGRGAISMVAIDRLRELSDCGRNLLLMCMEHSPVDCHRHHAITGPHFPGAIHIFEDALLLSSDLEDTIQSESEDCPVRQLASTPTLDHLRYVLTAF